VVILLDKLVKRFRDGQSFFSFVAMCCSISILVCSFIFVWLPSIKHPQLEVEWSSSYGNKDGNRLSLVNQSQSIPINITLKVYNTGGTPSHDVVASFGYTTGIGGYDCLLVYENNQYQTLTYSNSYQEGLLREGSSFSVIVLFRVSFYGIWNSLSKPVLRFQIYSTELPTINVEIELQLI